MTISGRRPTRWPIGVETVAERTPSGSSGASSSSSGSDLAAIEALATTGICCRVGANTWALRSLAVSGNGIAAVSNPSGAAGNPTISLDIGTGAAQVAAGNHTHAAVYEPVIAAGTSAQYWRGDKTWQTLTQNAVIDITTADRPYFRGLNLGPETLTSETKLHGWGYFDFPTNSDSLEAGMLTFEGVGSEYQPSDDDPSIIGTEWSQDTAQFVSTAHSISGGTIAGSFLAFYDADDDKVKFYTKSTGAYSHQSPALSFSAVNDTCADATNLYILGFINGVGAIVKKILVSDGSVLGSYAITFGTGVGEATWCYGIGYANGYLWISAVNQKKMIKANATTMAYDSEVSMGSTWSWSNFCVDPTGTYCWVDEGDGTQRRYAKILLSDLSEVVTGTASARDHFFLYYYADGPEVRIFRAHDEGGKLNPTTCADYYFEYNITETAVDLAVDGTYIYTFISAYGVRRRLMNDISDTPSTEEGTIRAYVDRLGTLVEVLKLDSNLNVTTPGSFVSTVAIGTAPLTVTSTTLVPNLNADMLDGYHASAFALAAHDHAAVYEPVIAAGTSAQYWRGDKTWQTLNQAAVAGLTTTDSPIFVTVKCTGLTTNYIPYHVSAAAGLADSPLYVASGRVYCNSRIYLQSPDYAIYYNKTLTDPSTGLVIILLSSTPEYTGAESTSEAFYVINSNVKPVVNAGHTNLSAVESARYNALRNNASAGSDDDGTLAALVSQTSYYGHADINAAANPQTSAAYGIRIFPWRKTGTIGTMGDIYLGPETGSGTVTNPYGILQINTKLNSFAGPIGIGLTSAQVDGCGGTQLIGIENGTAPSASITNAFLLYSADQTAGNACPHFRTENGAIVKLYQQAHLADEKTDYTTGDLDTEAEIIAAINATNTKINSVLAALENTGLLAVA